MARVAWMVSLLVLGATAAAAAQTVDPPVIVTRGQASIDRAPDMAWVTLVAESRAAEPRAAQQAAAEAMQTMQNAVRRVVDRNDIRTTGYALQPDMDRSGGRNRVIGYIARNTIEVRVEDLDDLGSVIDAAGASGATQMSGLRFDLKDRDRVERQALTLAVEDAMARARAIADGADAELGPIVRVDEDSMRSFRVSAAPEQRMAMQAQTPISPGELAITAQVTLTVQIR